MWQWFDPLGRRMERSFDTNGNIDRITLPGGAQFSYAYDGLMRLVRTIDPAGGVWTREYDAASTLTALIDPTGVSVRTSVDSSHKTITTNDGVDPRAYLVRPPGPPRAYRGSLR